MSVYKRGNHWWFGFRLRGVRYRRSVPEATTKKQAMAAETRFKNELLQGRFDLVDEGKLDITFSQYAKQYLKWSRENKRSYRDDVYRVGVLVDYFGAKRLYDITPIDIERFKVERRRTPTCRGNPRSPATINRVLSCLRHMFSLASKQGLIRQHPMKGGKVRFYRENNPVERYLTDDEETRLLAACTGRYAHMRPILITALYTGMRRGEIFNLKWSDIDFKKNRIRIRTSKSGKPRTIHMTPNVKAEISKLLPLRPETGFVFGNPHTGKARTDLKHGFSAICRAAGVHGFRFHDLRHTFATRFARETGNLVEVAHVLGHTQITTTMRYAHALPDKMADAMDRLAKPKATLIPMPKAKFEVAK